MLHRKPPDAHGPARDVSGGSVPRNPSMRTLLPGIGDELAIRAGLHPEWDAVLRAWIAGRGWSSVRACSTLPRNLEHP